MRLIILVLSVTSICGAGLIVPQVGILGYIWFGLMRPDVMAWSYWPYSMAIAVCTLAGSGRYLYRIGVLFTNPITIGVMALHVLVVISVLMAVNPDLSKWHYWRFIRTVTMAMLIPMLIDSEVWLRRLIYVIVGSMGLVALKMGVFAVIHGGVHFSQGNGGMTSDSNGIALAMAMLLPLAFYGRHLLPQAWMQTGFLAICACSAIVIVLTRSRGNALAAGIVALLIAFRSKYKILGIAGVAILIAPAMYLGGDMFVDRMSTLTDIEKDASAYGRWPLALAAIDMWKDYPLFGVGWGEDNFTALAPRYLGHSTNKVVHNTYIQVLVDAGLFAFLVYVTILWGTLIWLGVAARRMKTIGNRHGYYFAMAFQGSLLAWSIGSTFYSRGDFEMFYFILMGVAAWMPYYREAVATQTPQVQMAPELPMMGYRGPATAPRPARGFASAPISAHPMQRSLR